MSWSAGQDCVKASSWYMWYMYRHRAVRCFYGTRNSEYWTWLHITKNDTTYWYLKVDKVLASHPNVLHPGHQLAVEAAHRVPGQEAGSAGRQVVVDFPQVRQQCVVFVLVLLDQHQLQLAVQVLDQGGHFLVLKWRRIIVTFLKNTPLRWRKPHLHKQIVPAWHRLHDVSLDFVVLQNCQSVVDQDGRVCRFEVGAEVGRRFLHVHRCDLEGQSEAKKKLIINPEINKETVKQNVVQNVDSIRFATLHQNLSPIGYVFQIPMHTVMEVNLIQNILHSAL